jgi:hypothetical protein
MEKCKFTEIIFGEICPCICITAVYRCAPIPWVICSKIYRSYVKLWIIPNAMYNVIFM